MRKKPLNPLLRLVKTLEYEISKDYLCEKAPLTNIYRGLSIKAPRITRTIAVTTNSKLRTSMLYVH